MGENGGKALWIGSKDPLIYERVLLPLLSLVVCVVMAGEAVLTAALPVIGNEFAVPGVFESWILPVVLLVGAAAAPFIGTAGDRYGHRRLLIFCMFLYLFGLLGGLISTDIWSLLFSRALQGAGIASFPLAYALIRQRLPVSQADTGIGVISAMYGAGTLIGVIAGSVLTEAFGWKSTYGVLIPVTIILILGIYRYIPGSDIVNSGMNRGPSLDWIGLVSLLAVLFLGMSAFSIIDPVTGPGSMSLALLFCAIISGAIFIRTELIAPIPLADLRMAAKPAIILLLLIGTITILAFLMLLQEMPFIIESPTGLGLSAAMVGMILIPGTIGDMIAGPLTGLLVPKWGAGRLCVIGSVMLIIAAVLLLTGPSLMIIICAWFVFSAGMSTVATADIIAIIDLVPKTRTAEATGLIQSVQTIGGMSGPLIAGLLLDRSSVQIIHEGVLWTVPTLPGFTAVHFCALGAGVVVLICSVLLMSRLDKMDAAIPDKGNL